MKRLVCIFVLLIICLFSVVVSGFASVEDFIILDRARSTDAASQKLWEFILSDIKLSEKNAKLHEIYESDSRAVFYDLDDDGVSEIVGTHYATGSRRMGYNIMYILKKQKNGKYKDIGYRMFFAPNSPIFILNTKTKGFHDLRCYNSKSDLDSVFVFSKNIGKYVEKANQKSLEEEFFEHYF